MHYEGIADLTLLAIQSVHTKRWLLSSIKDASCGLEWLVEKRIAYEQDICRSRYIKEPETSAVLK